MLSVVKSLFARRSIMNAYKLPSGGEGLTGAVLTVALWSRPVYFLLALARPPSPQNRAEEGYGYRVRFVFVEGVVSFSRLEL